tara:strand:+ start:350 stop:547 length:198 start_codon:yes stop_codon:yes gene_type:complete
MTYQIYLRIRDLFLEFQKFKNTKKLRELKRDILDNGYKIIQFLPKAGDDAVVQHVNNNKIYIVRW